MNTRLPSRCAPLFASTVLLAIATNSYALQPRDYLPRPDGVTALQLLHLQTSGYEVYQNGTRASDQFNLNSTIEVLLPVHYSTFMGMPSIVEGIIPFGEVTLDGAAVGNASLSTSGLADPTALVGFWPVSDDQSQTWLGVSGWLTAPLGEYDNDRAFNLGKNQWAMKLQAGVVKGFGKLIVEIIPSVEFYTDNSDYGSNHQTLERDPTLAVETHVSYDMTSTFLFALDHFYTRGGESTTLANSGTKTTVDAETDSHAVQASSRLTLAANQFLNLTYRKDVKVENGPKANTFGVQYIFAF